MPSSERIRDRGRRRARRILQELASELRDARLSAGVSQRHVAEVAGLSQSALSRIERAEADATAIHDLAVHCEALGLQLSIKLYPGGSPARDAGQLRLLQRLRMQVSREFRWRSEAPIGHHGDQRAWDVRLDGPGSIGIDAETRLHDIQALQRRCETKWRDSGVDRLVLLVAATRHNRTIMRHHRDALRGTFPADTATVMAALRTGRLPESNGIVVL